MIIKFKTLKKEEFEVQIEQENINVGQLKALIAEKHGTNKYPVDKVKLVYAGNVMADSNNLGDYNYVSPSPIICMAPAKKQVTETPAPPPPPSPVEPVQAPIEEPSSSETMDGVSILVGMGFNRSEAEAALTASFLNVERAVEYLLSGNIPPADDDVYVPATQSHSPEDELERITQSLESSPHFTQIIDALRSNPSLISTLADTLQSFNPEIAEYIRQNPERVLQSLGIASSTRDTTASTEEAAPPVVHPPGSTLSVADVMPRTLNVSAEEMSKAQQLVTLGFTLEQCVEALRLCDGNMDQAANYLFSQLDTTNN